MDPNDSDFCSSEPEVEPNSLLRFTRKRRVNLIRQTESAECGLACLAMIAEFFGQPVGMLELRLKYPASSKGMDLARLIDIAHDLDLSSRPVRLELEQIAHLDMPCILHWGMNHFVVLTKITKRGAWINDPAVGIRFIQMSELSRKFSGVALELSSTANFKKRQPLPGISLRQLAGPLSGLTSSLLMIFCMAAALELIALLVPQFTQIIVDQVIADKDSSLLAVVIVAATFLLLINCGVTAMRTWTVIQIGATFSIGWTTNVFRHLVQLPQSYFLKRQLGDILSRFGSINTIQQTITTKFVEAILDGVMAIITFVMLGFYSMPIALISLGSVLGYLLLRLLYFHVYREGNLNQILTTAKQQGALMEAMRGIQTIQLHNKQSARVSQFMNLSADVVNRSIFVQRLQLIFDACNGLISGLQRIATIASCAWLGLNGGFTAGMLIAYLAYADQFSVRAIGLVDFLVQARLLRLQGERLADIVLSAPEDGTKPSGLVIPEGPLSVAFDDVSFRYDEAEPWVVRDLSFEVGAGESVAIVGPSGCGKSTTARLLAGLVEPGRGRILVNGLDTKHIGRKTLRDLISVVMQDDCLFAGSIAENICFFSTDATIERIQEAAIAASIHEDVISMPMGYHTLVGDMGSSLSGGQRQRLLLARALYRGTKLLLLDEATSHLDAMTEGAVNRAIRELLITRVVIAHREETIRSCDRVIAIDRGSIKHFASPEEYLDAQKATEVALGRSSLCEPALAGVH